MKYRNDIDGLRAIAVIAVILFHLGFLPNGYLGVDIFFVISGFLITSIVYYEAQNDKFSTLKFYERRIRRIIPLLLVTSFVAFLLGLYLMLPDDLENLSQSIVASNISANNILMLITSSDYWAVRNEYKPLMHTWSLGIEEQFYLIYPLIFFIFRGKRLKYILPILTILAIFSFLIFILPGNTSNKFFLLQYRFFELACGGISAIYFSKIKQIKKESMYVLYTAIILLLLVLIVPWKVNMYNVILTTIFTTVILAVGKYFYEEDKVINILLRNNVFVFLGKISFSLYMWHQIVFAFARYSFISTITIPAAFVLSSITLLLSVLTYYLVENTFRNRANFKFKYVAISLGILFSISTFSSFYVYTIGGIVKDYPSLDLYKKDNAQREMNNPTKSNNINIKYNSDIRKLDRPFENNGKPRILVIGNSYGRDVTNILLESSIGDKVDLSYFASERVFSDSSIKKRWQNANLIILAAELYIDYKWVHKIEEVHNFKADPTNLICFGTKDFGYSNGIHYSKLNSIIDYSHYYTEMKKGVNHIDQLLKKEWGNKYISLIEPISRSNNEVLVFTPNGKFISQDTYHLTPNGAKFYASLLNDFFSKQLVLLAEK